MQVIGILAPVESMIHPYKCSALPWGTHLSPREHVEDIVEYPLLVCFDGSTEAKDDVDFKSCHSSLGP